MTQGQRIRKRPKPRYGRIQSISLHAKPDLKITDADGHGIDGKITFEVGKTYFDNFDDFDDQLPQVGKNGFHYCLNAIECKYFSGHLKKLPLRYFAVTDLDTSGKTSHRNDEVFSPCSRRSACGLMRILSRRVGEVDNWTFCLSSGYLTFGAKRIKFIAATTDQPWCARMVRCYGSSRENIVDATMKMDQSQSTARRERKNGSCRKLEIRIDVHARITWTACCLFGKWTTTLRVRTRTE